MNTFPIRCHVVRVGYGLADVQSTLEKSGRDLEQGIIQAVIRQAALSLGVNVGLMFVPVMGQAIAGLMSIMQSIMGKKYEKDTQEIIARTTADIQERARVSEEEVQRVLEMVYEQEYPAGSALAASDQSLDGFGSKIKRAVSRVGSAIGKAGSAFDDAVHKFGEQTAHALAKAEDRVKEAASRLEDQAKVIATNPEAQLKFITTMSPVGLARLGIKYTLTGAKAVASGIESTNIIKEGTFTDPISKTRGEADRALYDAQRMTHPLTAPQEGVRVAAVGTAKIMEATGNEGGAEEARRVAGTARQLETALTPVGFYNLSTGREIYLEAKRQCTVMRASAFAAIDKGKTEAIALITSEKGRMEMRKSIAKELRQDPAFLTHLQRIKVMQDAERAEFEKLLAQEQAALAVLEQNAHPTTTSGAGAAIGIAAAAAAAFALS